VQSVALRLVCDRELEIEQFRAQEYWSILAELATAKNETFQARLFSVGGKKLEKFDIADEPLLAEGCAWRAPRCQCRKQVQRRTPRPSPPPLSRGIARRLRP
jgi:DNA topoisomerase-1